MRLWTRSVLWLVIAGNFGFVLGCRAEKPQEAKQVVPELRFEDVRYRVYREGRLAGTGDAREVTYRRDTGDVGASTISSHFPGEAGKPEVHATAVAGEGSLRTRDFLAHEGVTLEQGSDLGRSEEAHYRGAEGLVTGNRPVRVTGERYSLEGPGFTLDPQQGELTIRGGARLDAGAKVAR